MPTSTPHRRKSSRSNVPEPLSRYLRRAAAGGFCASPTAYVEQGAEHVTVQALAALRKLLPQLRRKAEAIRDSALLHRRLGLLLQYLEETSTQRGQPPPVRREIGFVLYYFLKGYDLIPDTVPEIGLVDDALLVETVLRRHQATLRTHWLDRRRTWPETD